MYSSPLSASAAAFESSMYSTAPAGSIPAMYPSTLLYAGNSANVSNRSDTQPLANPGNQLPAMSASAFGPQNTPGFVNAPFAYPYAASTPSAVASQFYVEAPLPPPPISSAIIPARTQDYSCTIVSIDGLEPGQGCVVRKENDATPYVVDLTGMNPFTFVNGSNNITVVGDPQNQVCNVQYTNAFDTGSFYLRPNASRFNVCI